METPGSSERASPYGSADGLISGSIERGTPKKSSSSSSQASLRMFISIVRLALVASVMCRPPSVPPVRFQISQLSIVPNSTSPSRARCSTPLTWSNSHRMRSAEK